ncbi:hypothetical protein CRE_01376 [Caenorhabditis remanei]|uniref:Uncharacterized protein n=1 Tax=Caenorhabditis remanei TaxID=31234 RepID=E3ND96_CAERE|nr:hypothetical protein CRE_01376 [Caenorhabditis remanei]
MTHNLYVVDAEGRRSMDARSRELLDKDSREIQTILVMGGITFFITIVMFLSKMDVSWDQKCKMQGNRVIHTCQPGRLVTRFKLSMVI